MANHPSAEKRNRQRIVRTERNRRIRSSVRTIVKKARLAIGASASNSATAVVAAAVVAAASALDRACSRGVVHPKAAARTKSRIAKAAHKASLAAKA